MKRIILSLVIITAAIIPSFGQSKSEMRKEIAELKAQLDSCEIVISGLESERNSLSAQIEEIKKFINEYPRAGRSGHETNVNGSGNSTTATTTTAQTKGEQCAAITKAGTRCSRTAKEGSKYCWQHHEKLNSTSTTSTSYDSGRVWYTGPRGGQYYINSKGNKVYRKNK